MPNVVVAKIDTPDVAEASTHDTLRGVRSYTWAMTGKLVVYRKDEDGTENYHLHALDVTTGADRDLTPIPRVQARLEARSREYPREVAVALNERDARAHDVFVVDVITGKRRLQRKNDEGMAAYVYDDELVPRVGLRVDSDGGTSYLVEDGTKRLTALLAKVPFQDTQATSPLGIDAAKRELYLVDSRGRDTAALVAIDLRTRASRVVVDDGQADIEGATFDPTTLRPDAAQATYAEPRWHLASDALARDFEALRELAKGDAFDVVTRSLDDTRWLVAVSSPVHPTRYFSYDRAEDPKATPVARVLFSASKELEALEPSPVFSRVIRARDGLSLVSYLTLPRCADRSRACRCWEASRRLLVAQHHPQLAADVWWGPYQHQRGDHAGVALGVLVWLEELARPVDQQVVQPGVQPPNPQGLRHLPLQIGKGAWLPVQRQPVGIDLAGVAHGGVEQGLFPQAEVGGFAERVQRLRLAGRERLGKCSQAFDRHGELVRGKAALGEEVGGRVLRRVGAG